MRNLATVILLITSLIGINACTHDRLVVENPIQPGEVIINGHINNYDGKDKTGILNFRNTITGLENQNIFFIDSIGNFKVSLELVCPSMIPTILTGNAFFQIYLVPGETYNVTINEDGNHVFTGENCELYNQVSELSDTLKSRFRYDELKRQLYYHSDSSDYHALEKFSDDLLKRKLAFVDEYCKKEEINQKVYDLIKLDLQYEPAWYLIGYRLGSSNKRNDLPEDFYQHLYDKFQINNPEAIGSKNYNMYIANIRYTMWEDYYFSNGIIEYLKMTQRFSERELFLISKNLIRDTTVTKTKEFIEFFDDQKGEITELTNKYLTNFLLDSVRYFANGLGRDLIISQGISLNYLRDATFSPSPDEWIQIESLISNKKILSYLRKFDQSNQEKVDNTINNKTTIISPLLKNESDKVFEKLIGRYNGKVVYIDFWATWCGPCRQEIPHSKILSSHFAGQEVVFLNLCCQSDKKNWETTIKSEQLTGNHYLLSSDEYNILSKLFNIQGVPTYVLLDKKGNITDKNAPRPSDGPMTINAIDKLLK